MTLKSRRSMSASRVARWWCRPPPLARGSSTDRPLLGDGWFTVAADLGFRPRFFPVYLGFSTVAVADFFGRPPRKFPARPISDLVLLTSVSLIPPSRPAFRHASLTALALACGLPSSTSLTNSVFPWPR